MLDSKKFRQKFKELNEKILQVKNIDRGMLGGINEKYWVECNDKQYLFKYTRNENDFSDFGEVFVSYICHILGVSCVKSIFSDDIFEIEPTKNNGVLIESYRTEDVKESFTLKSLMKIYFKCQNPVYTVNDIHRMLKFYSEDNNIELDKKIVQQLKEMALIDYLTIQFDRHAGNIEFLIKEKNDKRILCLAPIYDNGFCLHLSNNIADNMRIYKKLNKGIVPVGLNHFNPKPRFYIEESEGLFDHGECIVKDLASELRRNKKLKKIYDNFLNLNIENEVEFIDSLAKKPLLVAKRKCLIKAVQNRIKLLEMELLKQENSSEEELVN